MSFLYIAAVVIQSACTAIQTIGWFHEDTVFDTVCLYLFVFVFISYHLYFLINAGWLRHKESMKLYMDSEQLEEHVEDNKHQLQMRWSKDPNGDEMDFRGKKGQIASFTDVDPLLQLDNMNKRKIDGFCQFICIWIGYAFIACIKCKCCKAKSVSQQRRENNHARKTSRNLIAAANNKQE